METGTFDEMLCAWESDLRGLNFNYLTLLRSALRDQMPLACRVFGLRNFRLARRVEALDRGQLQRLASCITTNFLTFDEALAMETLVDQVVDPGQGSEVRPWHASTALPSADQPVTADSATWLSSLQALKLSYLLLMRQVLREDFARARQTFGMANRRFAQRLQSMDMGQVLLLNDVLPLEFIKFNDTLPMEVLVERVLDNGSEEEIRMSIMAHAATDLSLRCGAVGVQA